MFAKLTCDISKWCIIIKCNDEAIMNCVLNVLGGFNIEKVPNAYGIKNVIEVTVEDKIYVKYKDSVYCAEDVIGTFFLVCEAIDFYTKNAAYSHELSENYCILHGGCVSFRDKVIGILAPSMTGKSTMICELVLQGCKYLADDYVFYENGRITPFPLPLRLRDISRVSNSVKNYILFEGYNPYTKENEYMLDFKEIGLQGRLSDVLLIERRENCNNIKRIGIREGFITLLLNEKRADKNEINNNYFKLLQIARNIPIYKILYNESKDMVEKIMNEWGDF